MTVQRDLIGTVKLIYQWKCFACGAEVSQDWLGGPGGDLPLTHPLPGAWTAAYTNYSGLVAICPKHTVQVSIDGDPIEEIGKGKLCQQT